MPARKEPLVSSAVAAAAGSAATTLSRGQSSSLQPTQQPQPTMESGDYLSRSLTTGETGELGRTNALADRNTIVDMSLRLGRFLVFVFIALAAAFAFALVTNYKLELTTVSESDVESNSTLSATASDMVETYNTLFGYIIFTGSKIFEIFCETLIFPTLATYLHNCSLYPGDEPVRVYSRTKARSIFWGLKIVIILMNVGFASVYVGQTTKDNGTGRRLEAISESDGALLTPPMAARATDQAAVFQTILRTSATGVTAPFEFQDACSSSQEIEDEEWEAWADDVDTTFVSFGFPSHDWNARLLSSSSSTPPKSADIPLGKHFQSSEKYQDDWELAEWDAAELFATFQQGLDAITKRSTRAEAMPTSLEALVRAVTNGLEASLPDTVQLSDAVLRVESHEVAEDVQFSSLTLSVPMKTAGVGSTQCEAEGCIYATSSTVQQQLGLQAGLAMAPYDLEEDAALIYGAGTHFELDDAAASTSSRTAHEVLVLSFGKLSWQLSPLHLRHDISCDDESEDHCLGLSLELTANDGVLLISEEALATARGFLPVQLVTLHPASIPDMAASDDGALVTWYRLVTADGKRVSPDMVASPACTPLVDAYLTHLTANHFYLEDRPAQAMHSAALFYLLQRGVSTPYAATTSRRRLALEAASASGSSGSGDSQTTEIDIAVPFTSAVVTVVGCVGIILLMLCVVYLPTSRVKLSPDTTPAAQYVQILTDDLYPDVVHKKRLRFANGDCLLFNEYIVDAIVLHAKRDQSKKIYL